MKNQKNKNTTKTLHDFADLEKAAILQTEQSIPADFKNTFERSEIIIYKTTNYDMFSYAPENRDISNTNVKVIKSSILRHDLKIPIYVTRDFIIIDGQHTLVARKELKRSIYFIVTTSKDYHNDIIIFNTKRRNWGIANYIDFYAKLGKPSYQLLQQLKINSPIAITFLGGILMYGAEFRTKVLKEGNFEHTLTDLALLTEMVDFLEAVVIITDGHLPRTHGVLLIKWAFFHKNFNRDHLVEKLKLQSKKNQITWNSNPRMFAIEVETIYNKYTPARNKIRLF